jgi:type IV pilus assembly protein PilN
MDELSRRLPEWVWLSEVVYDSKGIQIKGRALSNNLIADYISSLESSPQVMNVNLVSSTQRTIQGDQYLEFSLRAALETKPEPPPPPPPADAAAKPAAKKKGRTS